MPSKSKSQRRLMAMVLQYKRGKLPKKYHSEQIKKLADTMTEDQLEDFAKTKGLKEGFTTDHLITKIINKVAERLGSED